MSISRLDYFDLSLFELIISLFAAVLATIFPSLQTLL